MLHQRQPSRTELMFQVVTENAKSKSPCWMKPASYLADSPSKGKPMPEASDGRAARHPQHHDFTKF
jgi:hypothetical protein